MRNACTHSLTTRKVPSGLQISLFGKFLQSSPGAMSWARRVLATDIERNS